MEQVLQHQQFGKLPYIVENGMTWFPRQRTSKILGLSKKGFSHKQSERMKAVQRKFRFNELEEHHKFVIAIPYEFLCSLVSSMRISPEKKQEYLSWFKTAEPNITSATTNEPENVEETPVEPTHCFLAEDIMDKEIQDELGTLTFWHERIGSVITTIASQETRIHEMQAEQRRLNDKLKVEQRKHTMDFKDVIWLKEQLGAARLNAIKTSYSAISESMYIPSLMNPTEIAKFINSHHLVSQDCTNQIINNYLVKWDYQTKKETKTAEQARYDVNPQLGRDYAYIKQEDGKGESNNKTFLTLCWTYKGLALIIGSLLFEERYNEGKLALAV